MASSARSGLSFLALVMGLAAVRDDSKLDGSGIVIYEKYSGTHADKAKEVLGILKDFKSTALKTIHQQLGYDKPIKVPIRVTDRATVKGALAETGGFGAQVTMIFCLDNLIEADREKDEIELTYTHELVHAYLRQYISSSNYELIPRWMQEGIAVYGANQMDDRIHREMKKDPKDPMAFVKKLEAGNPSKPGYIESSLLFDYIKTKHGEAKLKGFASRLLGISQNQSLQKIIQEATGETQAGLMKNGHTHAVEIVRRKIQEFQKEGK